MLDTNDMYPTEVPPNMGVDDVPDNETQEAIDVGMADLTAGRTHRFTTAEELDTFLADDGLQNPVTLDEVITLLGFTREELT